MSQRWTKATHYTGTILVFKLVFGLDTQQEHLIKLDSVEQDVFIWQYLCLPFGFLYFLIFDDHYFADFVGNVIRINTDCG